MDIVLRNKLILITTGFDTLNSSWMKDFLNHHSRGMLFLPKAVLVLNKAFEYLALQNTETIEEEEL